MREISSAVPGAIAALLRDAPMSPGKIEFAWNVAVGAAFGKVTTIKLEGTSLLVDATTGHWAREIGRATPTILQRLRHLLGEETVTTITVRSRQADSVRPPGRRPQSGEFRG